MFDGPEMVIVVVVLCLGLLKIFRGPVGDAVAARIKGHQADPSEMEVLAEVDALKARLAEVEERLDFAERLLAKASAADQLHGGIQR